jgi:hypothetical protein
VLYATRAAYDARVDAEIDSMQAEGWVLERDRARLVERAGKRWDWLMGSR